MTKTTPIHYIVLMCLLITFTLIAVSTASASEVTGNLSSVASSNTQSTSTISDTVSSGNSGGSTGGSSTLAPSGSVLGVATTTPNFPNAGNNPHRTSQAFGIWSKLITFFRLTLAL
jgi:hypothetical protein